MPLIITGSHGNIGRRLMAAFPDAIGIDRHPDADIVEDLSTIDYEATIVRRAFETCDGLIHVATSADVEAPDAVRFGWVPKDPGELETAPDWLRANYWDDQRLIAEVRAALG
ncbi:MAG: hypothetical protein ACYCZU_04310 [Devosia sp.]